MKTFAHASWIKLIGTKLTELTSRLLRPVLLIGALAVAGWVALPNTASAQGIGIYQMGSCVMTRGGAGVANGCDDGSSIFFNPSHLADAEDFTATLGTTLFDINGNFTYGSASQSRGGSVVDLQNDDIPVPHAYFSYGLADKIGLGFGAYAPYGLGVQWPEQTPDGSTFEGAFEGFDNQLQTFYLQPSISYQVTPDLSIGGGPVVVVSTVEMNLLQDLSQVNAPSGDTFGELGVPAHTPFARTNLDQTGIGFGANIGLSYAVSDRLDVGLRYTTPVTVDYDGTASFEQVESGFSFPADTPLARDLDGDGNSDPTPVDLLIAGQFDSEGVLNQFESRASEDAPLESQSAETEMTFPMQLVAGLSFQATPKLLLLADYQFTGWSSFDELPLEFERLDNRLKTQNYGDTHALRVGVEYDILDALAVRGGYAYTTSAVPNETMSPFLPESTRDHYTLGFGWNVTDMVEVNVSYQRLQQDDRTGSLRPALPEGEVDQGLFNFKANYVGATFTLHL